MITPIGDSGSDVRQWSNKIFNHIIKPAVEPDYAPVRAQDIDQSGLVTAQIVDRLINDDLTIADLTDGNPNVYYEVAIRHAVKKPIVHLIKSGQTPRFDIQGMRAIPIDNDLEVASKAVISLKNQVKKFEKDSDCLTTPISQAINLAEINKSADPSTQALGNLDRKLTEILNRLPGRSVPDDPPATFEAVRKQEFVVNVIKKLIMSVGPYSIDDVIDYVIESHKPLIQNNDFFPILNVISDMIKRGVLISDSKQLTGSTIISLP